MTLVDSSRVAVSDVVLSRRRFVQGSMIATAWSYAGRLAARDPLLVRAGCENRSVIMLCNYGGPGQLDTWDPKPDAPLEVRGPFQAIRTTVPDFFVSELFPRHAQIAHHLAVVRSCHHDAPAVHAVGWQLMQTARECLGGVDAPHIGCFTQYLLGGRSGLPGHVVLPASLRGARPGFSAGQSAGCLGAAYDPHAIGSVEPPRRTPDGSRHGADSTVCRTLQKCTDLTAESSATRRWYGDSRLGRRCLVARRLVEAGVRFVTINTGGDQCLEESWDVHGTAPYRSLTHLKQSVAPAYDQAVAALVADLAARGLLADTLVCCLAEFGRTPRVNPDGGRDHWPQCYSVYFAGGGVQGGQVVGRSDALASEPIDRPVRPAEVVATVCRSLGIEPATRFTDAAGIVRELIDPGVQPIHELF